MKTLAKTSTKRKGGKDFGRNKERGKQSPKGSPDIYQKFTDLIIEKLEQGVIPWKQPWHEMGMPSNYLTKKPYKGINLWLLLSCGPHHQLTGKFPHRKFP
ncbi:ArdC family protein [Algoriphagus halophytocola]|uniref:ArdC family protein n=1 Tax=Algoriphagus halophytocola TaxID=2991499 RepID=A0ABY6MGM0_9BACT|nr:MULTISPECIES: ArdC family protein [unclassified Algoriphagus]UZD22950.1 ArdC family protein [Algoriphagus sp. TR-M5]WBL44219.1 ArdC family protein [Algoriphagus sp. TR-M9]